MLDEFFTPEPFMIGHEGFELFGAAHLLWLAAAVCAIATLSHAYCWLSPSVSNCSSPAHRAKRSLLLAIAAIPLCMAITRVCIHVSVGVTHPNWWPLHVCNLCELLAFVYAIKPNRVMGNILFGVGLPTSILALLFPSWSYCPPLCWASICGFCEHALVAACVVCLLRSRELEPRLHDVWQPLAVLCVYVVVMYPLNYALGTNFAFLKDPPYGSPLVPLAGALGHPGYLVPLLVFVAVIVVALFLWSEYSRKR